ncbi:MAG TPA: sucrose phosphorylase [Vicinamibacterales bacterium]|jgi:sucrose phosphorylase
MKNQAQLITYVDRFSGGGFRDLQTLLEGPLKGAFAGIHVLPFFHPIDGADAGFDPIDHTQVDPRLGTWDDVAALAARTDVLADLVVNHISRHSPQFQDYVLLGADSPYAGMFLTYSRVFPDGARESDLIALHTPRPGLPFTRHRTASHDELLWTTFTGDQIDIDVHHPEGRRYFANILARFHDAGIKAIRLDAVGFAIKRAGTSCFMIPETFAFISDFAARAHELGMEVLVEVHGHYQDQIDVARQVDWVYDFAFAPLVLHTLYARDVSHLRRWFEIRPGNAVIVLDTHDGIGVEDVDAGGEHREAAGLLQPREIKTLVETIHLRSGGGSRLASGSVASNVDTTQINCTFYDALGRSDPEYLIARAIQCFVPGIPQIYYVGLLAGGNDLDLLGRTGVGRDINRHYYTAPEVQHHLSRPVVQALLSLLRFRNTHAAFGGIFEIQVTSPDEFALSWKDGLEFARLDVNLARMRASITCSRAGSGAEGAAVWQSAVEA